MLSRIRPACVANPTKVPAVSKNVTSKKVSTTTTSCKLLMSPTWLNATINVGFKLGAADTNPVGMLMRPVTRPKMTVATIPMKIPPGTCFTIRIAVTTRPKMVSQVVPTPSEPKPTIVDLLAVMRPPSLRPRNAMKRPIPPEIAAFKSLGIASIIFSRNLKIVIMIKMMEATNTPANAVSHGTFIPIQTE